MNHFSKYTFQLLLYFLLLVFSACTPKTLLPGVEVSHNFLNRGIYLSNPSIIILANGDFVTSFDTYGPMTLFGKNGTFVFASKNKGEDWQQLAYIPRLGGASIFQMDDALYLMGTLASTEETDLKSVVICRSVDNGATWSEPADSDTGLLLNDGKMYDTAPVPVVWHKGRIWRAMEDRNGSGDWPANVRSFVMSAPESANLMKAESWMSSNELYGNVNWLDGSFEGWSEGNIVIDRQGNVINLLSVRESKKGGLAAITELTDNGQTLKFQPEEDFVKIPGGSKKFTIRYDKTSGLYWALTNYVPKSDLNQKQPATQIKNTVALVLSRDLKSWKVKKVVLHDNRLDTRAIQCIDWAIDGDDMVAVAQTTWEDEVGEPNTADRSNYIMFFRVEDFRK